MKHLLLLFLFFSSYGIGHAQSNGARKSSIGIMPGMGSQAILNVQYHYTSFLLQLEWSKAITGGNGQNPSPFQIELMLQSQSGISYSRFAALDLTQRGLETGINGGFKLVYQKAALWQPYVAIHAGPHYISNGIKRQVPGFIFSDNFSTGFLYKITNDFHLDLRLGIRHLSNAGIRNPNGGINSTQISIGMQFR